jgi:IS30 family transposase
MPKGYDHLTYDKRCQIKVLLERGFLQKEIAEDLGVHQSTISREIARNSGGKGYRHKQAQEKMEERRRKKSDQRRKMNPSLSIFVEAKIRELQWSPDQISGRLKLQNVFISHETIYKYIWQDKKQGGDLYKYLRRSGKKYNKRSGKLAGRGLIPNRIGIEHRPEIVNQKIRIGDIEEDTIIGANHKGAIVTIVERVSKFIWLALVDRSTAQNVAEKTIELLAPIKDHLHTITSDNGKEFAEHQQIANTLQIDFYFANPYASWERGLNENSNGLLRQYIPKKTDFSSLTQQDIDKFAFLLNTRPRKSLNYATPLEVLLRSVGVNFFYALRT